MREQRENNFWSDVFKWFLIWNLLSLLFRGFMFVCKVMIIAMEQLIHITAIGIKKLIPIVKDKVEQLKIDYAQKYRPRIDNKIFQMEQFFFNICANLKNKSITLKNKGKDYSANRIIKKKERKKNKSFRKMQNQRLRQESNFALSVKKTKYRIIDFFYTYEFQILIIGILGIGIAVTFVILNVIMK